MKRLALVICCAAVVLFALGTVSSVQAKLRVEATTADLAAVARAVGGQRIAVDSLAHPGQDPHFVDARPHLMLRLNKADLLLVVGLQLEVGWLPTLLTGARNPKIARGAAGYLDASTLVRRLEQVPQRQVNRSEGDVHPGGNPHYLLGPSQVADVARGIAKRLAELDRAGADTYRANAERFVSELTRRAASWRKRMAPFAGRNVVAFHNAWVYVAKAFGFEVVGFFEPKPGIPPNPSHLLQLIKLMRRDKVRVILQQRYYPIGAAQRLVAQKTAAEFVVIDGGARADEPYLARLQRLVDKLYAALSKTAEQR